MIMMLKLKRDEIEGIRRQITLQISRTPQNKDLSTPKRTKTLLAIMEDKISLIKTRSITGSTKSISTIRTLTMVTRKTLTTTLNINRVAHIVKKKMIKLSIRRRTRSQRRSKMGSGQPRIRTSSNNSIRRKLHLSSP